MTSISSGEQKVTFLAIDEKAKSVGLQVNGEKTKYMLSSLRASSQERVGPKVNIGNYDFEVVNNFIYLGTEVTSDNNITSEVKRRIMLANRCLEQINAFKTIITESKGEALPPANYASFTLRE